MIFVYGSYIKKIGQSGAKIANECPNCHSTNALQMEVTCEVGHLYYLPFFPEKKQVVYTCTVYAKQYPPTLFPAYQREADELLGATKYKWKLYLGPILIGIIGAIIGVLYLFSGPINRYMSRPGNVGTQADGIMKPISKISWLDVIYYKTADNKISSAKVEDVKGDTIFVKENTAPTAITNTGYRAIDVPKNYAVKKTFYLVATLEKMKEEGKLISIN